MAFDFVDDLNHTPPTMRRECDRTQLIAELSSLLRDCELPEEARTAGLTLIGFLARRMPGEAASSVGVAEGRKRLNLLSRPSVRILKKPAAL